MSADLRIAGKKSMATYPVIIPPIVGKSSALHHNIKGIWDLAQKRLERATDVVIFGYSFPQTDYESVHLLEDTIGKGKSCRRISVINPDASVVVRMRAIPKNNPVMLFPDVERFLQFRAGLLLH